MWFVVAIAAGIAVAGYLALLTVVAVGDAHLRRRWRDACRRARIDEIVHDYGLR